MLRGLGLFTVEHGFFGCDFNILHMPYGDVGLGTVEDDIPVDGGRNGTN